MCGEWQGDGSGLYDNNRPITDEEAEKNWGCIVGAAKIIAVIVILAALIGMLR